MVEASYCPSSGEPAGQNHAADRSPDADRRATLHLATAWNLIRLVVRGG